MVQTYSENTQIKQENDRSDDFVSPDSSQATYSQPSEFSVHGNLDMSSLGQTVWSLADQLRPLEEQGIHPLDSPFFFQSWTQQHYDHHEQECQAVRNEHSRESMPNQDTYIFTTMSTIMPPTPPVAPVTGLTDDYPSYATIADFSPPRALTGSFSAPKLPITSRSSSTSSTHKSKTNTFNRRHSADVQRLHGARRSSAHPSVASVVSLTAHEPVAKVIDGIEHITFLYSHDRLVKEYTVRTDVESVNLDDVSINFRIQNAIYPRANVDRSDYDGNRWDYETTCNQLGWKLCWLNREQLFGRRGLIQRAVDSYRNRHADMRSRRVTRQEKVANGTLRKRRVKKSMSHIL